MGYKVKGPGYVQSGFTKQAGSKARAITAAGLKTEEEKEEENGNGNGNGKDGNGNGGKFAGNLIRSLLTKNLGPSAKEKDSDPKLGSGAEVADEQHKKDVEISKAKIVDGDQTSNDLKVGINNKETDKQRIARIYAEDEKTRQDQGNLFKSIDINKKFNF